MLFSLCLKQNSTHRIILCNLVTCVTAVLFSMYIDPLLVELSKSGYGCHLDRVYRGGPSYVDDITISCPVG